jgi:uncharacterized protein YndB with AHSA1/START domain
MTYEIRHEVGVRASPHEVYEALTDVKKLAAWWTSDTRGKGAKVGDVLEFWFDDFCQKFQIIKLQEDKFVHWKATQKESMDEWFGTEIIFSIEKDEKQTIIGFTHSGWESADGMLPHCSTKWAIFMLSLKELLEKGKGRPTPDDIEINYW